MSRIKEKIVLIILDLFAVNASFILVYVLKYHTGFLTGELPPTLTGIVLSAAALSTAWFLVFLVFGLYRSRFAVSRTDEIVTIFKAVTAGTVILFILTLDVNDPFPQTRINIFNYWALLIFFLSVGRITVRTYQRNLLKKGRGRRKTLIVGSGQRAREIYDQICSRPLTGFDVQGFLDPSSGETPHLPSELILGDLNDYKDVCTRKMIEEVLIILDDPSKETLFQIVDMCNGYPAALKTIPDIYEIAVGNARIQHLFGLDLVDILPENFSPWFRMAKQTFDIMFALTILFLLLPVWVLIGITIKASSKGSVFYRQKRIGRNGEEFMMYKFRSMVKDADKTPDPLLTKDRDPRITPVGHFLRKFRIDEVPQLINVLEGDMSLIGPRPELPYFVQRYMKQIPLYSKRLRVKPGITGLAQVKQRFSESVKDIQKKLEYDLYYIENMSLKLDLKIFLATIFTILGRRGG